MVRIVDSGMIWPGFGYSDAEMARFRVLAAPIDGPTYRRFALLTALLFILLAALGVGAMTALLLVLYPDMSVMPASVFVAFLAAVALFCLGWGLPVAMRIAAGILAGRLAVSEIPADSGDADLAAKVRYQLRRMTALVCGLFVPGALLWIAWDIQAGPVIAPLKGAAVVLMAGSIWIARRRH